MRTAKPETAELWRRRIKAAELFQGSIEEYCRSEGLQTSSFYGWRRRFSRERGTLESVDAQSMFAPAVITGPVLSRVSDQRVNKLPDAKWVGEMLAFLVRGLS